MVLLIDAGDALVLRIELPSIRSLTSISALSFGRYIWPKVSWWGSV